MLPMRTNGRVTPAIMARLAHGILVVCTVFATFLAASLQGRVLCSADGGGHFAIEAPHPETGCPGGHDEHHGTDAEHRDAPADCTDVSAEFAVARELTPASVDVLHAPLTCVTVALPPLLPGPADLSYDSLGARGHPPAAGDLARLRTIILLA